MIDKAFEKIKKIHWGGWTNEDFLLGLGNVGLNWDFSQWLISDLIPKKSEKFEFRKNFVTIFFSVKNWPKKWNFDFFCPRNFRKIAKLSSKFRSGIFTWKMENFEKTHFASESALNSVCMEPNQKSFWSMSQKLWSIFNFWHISDSRACDI